MHFTTESLYGKIACFYKNNKRKKKKEKNKVVATEFTYV